MKIVWRKDRLFLALNVFLAILATACILIGRSIQATLPTLRAAESWKGESGIRFSQIGCYLPHDEPLKVDSIYQFRGTLESKLKEASMEAPAGGKLYTDAYCGFGAVTLESERGSAKVKAVGVGGDFFRFHPLVLRSGVYLAEDDLMKDRLVLDEETAWQLFGALDVAGMSARIGDESYYVAGVVRREQDKYSQLAYTEGGGIFMSMEALQKCQPESGITVYEAVLPNPISDYAKNMVHDNFSVGNGVVVDNNQRYSVSNLFSVIGDFGKRSMGVNGIVYPYWENAVRLTEDYSALLLLLTLLFSICPVISLIVFLIRKLVFLIKDAEKKTKQKLSENIEKRREKKWQEAAGKKG